MTAAAIVHVQSQPSVFRRRVTVNGPITRASSASSIMNLAIADVNVLARALAAHFKSGDGNALEQYSRTCLARVWRAEHFSWWMTSMLHRFPGDDPFQRRLQRSQLDYTVHSRAAAASLAENYVGLPFD